MWLLLLKDKVSLRDGVFITQNRIFRAGEYFTMFDSHSQFTERLRRSPFPKIAVPKTKNTDAAYNLSQLYRLPNYDIWHLSQMCGPAVIVQSFRKDKNEWNIFFCRFKFKIREMLNPQRNPLITNVPWKVQNKKIYPLHGKGHYNRCTEKNLGQEKKKN